MVKVKGSKDGTIISARFEGKSKSLFSSLKETKALVLLSIKGNQYCVGDYLQAIIERACSDHQFVTFLIADEIYWHNLKINHSDSNTEQLKAQARDLGINYLNEHLVHFIKPLNISMSDFDNTVLEHFPLDNYATLNQLATKHSNFEVVLWSDWLAKSASYQELSTTIEELYLSEDSLKNSVDATAEDYTRRHATEHNKHILKMCSSDYLREESPAVMWIAAQLGYEFVVYPGEEFKPFIATKEYFISGCETSKENKLMIHHNKPNKLVNWLEVSFQRSHAKPLVSKKRDTDNSLNALAALMKGATEAILASNKPHAEQVNLIADLMIQINEKV